jgi:RNA polymerase sigma-70 factor (ECF subfamily)
MTHNDLSDEILIARAARGDAGAFEVLYDRYASTVLGLALKITGQRATAEEVVQETFWRVWRNATTYEAHRGAFAGWMFGIARNLSIDALRRRKVRPEPTETEADAQRMDDVPDPSANVADATSASLDHHAVRRALANLPETQRVVIELSYFGGLTRQEIAERTGEPLGTVHTRVRLGLLKLREALHAVVVGE